MARERASGKRLCNLFSSPGFRVRQGDGGGGRDRFAPGDKVWRTIPKLGEPDSQAAIKAGDWFAQVEVIMGDLSEGSGEWWALIMKCDGRPMIDEHVYCP